MIGENEENRQVHGENKFPFRIHEFEMACKKSILVTMNLVYNRRCPLLTRVFISDLEN